MQNHKLKSLTLLFATLLIGFVLGALVMGVVVREKVQTARAFTTQDGFIQQVETLIKPTNARQKKTVDRVLQRYGARVESLFDSSRQELATEIDNMTLELTDVITSDQLSRLDEKRNQLDKVMNREL